MDAKNTARRAVASLSALALACLIAACGTAETGGDGEVESAKRGSSAAASPGNSTPGGSSDRRAKRIAEPDGRQPSSKSTGSSLTEGTAVDPNYYREVKRGPRIYVFGTAKAWATFEESRKQPDQVVELPGDGPAKEALVLEAGKPGMAARLQQQFFTKHPDAGGNYWEAKVGNRIYVFGRRVAWDAYQRDKTLPAQQRPLVGEGPKGETIVLQVDKNDPTLATRLQKTFFERCKQKEKANVEAGDYFEVRRGRWIYVFGSKKSRDRFLANKAPAKELARRLVNSGPDGETLVFETSPGDPKLVERLMRAFSTKHGVLLR